MKERSWRADLVEKRCSVRATYGQEQRKLVRKLLKTGQRTLFCDEVIWKTVGIVETLIEFDPWIGLTSSQIYFAVL